MIFQAYNEESVHNLQINKAAENLCDEGFMSTPQYEQVKTAFPVVLSQPNLFVRLGLFLFTFLCIGFTIGFGILIFSSAQFSQSGWGVLVTLFGICLTAMNEFIIREGKWYRQGTDNALCYTSLGFVVLGLSMIFQIDRLWFFSVTSFVLLTIAAVRYGDPLLALGAFYALLMSFFALLIDSEKPMMILPFVGMTLSAAVYFFAKNGSKRDDWFYWEDCFTVLQIASLFAFYLSVNYYFVSTNILNNPESTISSPYSIVFAFLTAVVPLVYFSMGIQSKDRILWVMGFLGIVASIITYRFYHSIMPIEFALTLAGAALLILSILGIKYLKTPLNGFVYSPKPSKSNFIESLVVNQLLQNAAHSSTPENDLKFGGGDFDGGGAGNEF